MAVKLRLSRGGAKKAPHYYVVATDSRNPRDGKFIEQIGAYNPSKTPVFFEVDDARLAYWLKAGAQPSEMVADLLRRNKKPNTAAQVK